MKRGMLTLMSQPTLFRPPSLSVGELTRYLRQLLESDEILQDIWVQGELSNVSRPASGHLYFTIKDSSAALRCVMWKNAALRLKLTLRDGMGVEVHGSIGVYEVGGQYQLYTDQIRPVGEGALYQEFLRLKGQLEAEGLFAPERKRPLPAWPHRIGIVTSPTGAALQDMLNVLRRRYPMVEVILAPTPVQGEEAPGKITAALREINRLEQPDLIILARGGGSLEDLWAFNDEGVARAIAASSAPVITGIGHETDFTIADFAADLRAPTPTAAAELATPDRAELQEALILESERLRRAFENSLSTFIWNLRDLQARFRQQSPLGRIQSQRQHVDELQLRVQRAGLNLTRLHQAHLLGMMHHLQSLNPAAVLERGYAIITREKDGTVVKSVQQVQTGEVVLARLSNGRLQAQINQIETTPSKTGEVHE